MKALLYYFIFIFLILGISNKLFSQKKELKKQHNNTQIVIEGLTISNNLKWGKFKNSHAKRALETAYNLTDLTNALIHRLVKKEDFNVKILANNPLYVDFFKKYNSANEFEKQRLTDEIKQNIESASNKSLNLAKKSFFITSYNCQFNDYSFSQMAFPVLSIAGWNSSEYIARSNSVSFTSPPELFPNFVEVDKDFAEKVLANLNVKTTITVWGKGEARNFRGARVIVITRYIISDAKVENRAVYSIYVAPASNEVIAVLETTEKVLANEIRSIVGNLKNNPNTGKNFHSLETFLKDDNINASRVDEVMMCAKYLDIDTNQVELSTAIAEIKKYKQECVEFLKTAISSQSTFFGEYNNSSFTLIFNKTQYDDKSFCAELKIKTHPWYDKKDDGSYQICGNLVENKARMVLVFSVIGKREETGFFVFNSDGNELIGLAFNRNPLVLKKN